MKRFLTTLAILIVVILAGLTTLVLLVNPNDFRHYLIDKVEQKVAIIWFFKAKCVGMYGPV